MSPIAPTDVTDMAFVGAFVVIGALFGSLVLNVGGVPLTLSTAGGALIAGIIGGWLRSVRPSFGRIPTPTIWFMNSVGLNIFIAIVGISAGPGFVDGLETQGVGLFLWGGVATTVPLLGMFVGRYVPASTSAHARHRLRGRHRPPRRSVWCAIRAKPGAALGYTVAYAVGNAILTPCGHGPHHDPVMKAERRFGAQGARSMKTWRWTMARGAEARPVGSRTSWPRSATEGARTPPDLPGRGHGEPKLGRRRAREVFPAGATRGSPSARRARPAAGRRRHAGTAGHRRPPGAWLGKHGDMLGATLPATGMVPFGGEEVRVRPRQVRAPSWSIPSFQ